MKMTIIFVFLFILAIACNQKQSQNESQNQNTAEGQNTESQAIDAAHNSQNSLDWEGIYTGIIPAADGEGIRVNIEIKYNHTFKITYGYIGKSEKDFMTTGTFKWSKDGATIILDIDILPRFYKVGENVLFQLDMDGKRIEGPLAEKYILRRKV